MLIEDLRGPGPVGLKVTLSRQTAAGGSGLAQDDGVALKSPLLAPEVAMLLIGMKAPPVLSSAAGPGALVAPMG